MELLELFGGVRNARDVGGKVLARNFIDLRYVLKVAQPTSGGAGSILFRVKPALPMRYVLEEILASFIDKLG